MIMNTEKRFSDEYPPDPELSEDERKRYGEIIDFPEGWGVAFNYEQSCLLRKRLNFLNASSKRIENATYVLLIATFLLLFTAIVTFIHGNCP